MTRGSKLMAALSRKSTRRQAVLAAALVLILYSTAKALVLSYKLAQVQSELHSAQQKAASLEENIRLLAEDLRSLYLENNLLRAETNKLTEEKNERVETYISVSRGSPRSFADLDLLTPSHVTPEALDSYLAQTRLKGLGGVFWEAERSQSINALALASMALWESSRGTSELSLTKNNLFGYQAYDHNVEAARNFKSWEECILFVAQEIRANYLTPGGIYHHGYTLRAMNKRYASDQNWSEGIATVWAEIAREVYK